MITSTSNAKVKYLVNLKKKRKERDRENVFLVEGIRMFREVPADKLKEVYVSEFISNIDFFSICFYYIFTKI